MKKNLWPILALLLLTLFFFKNQFLNSEIFTAADFGRGDLTHFNYPLKDFLGESLKNFSLPLWNNNIFSGFPVFAEGQIGALFGPNLILFAIFPTWLAFNLGYFVIYLTASIGTYFYLRFLNLKKLSSLFGAVSFAFSFFFIGHTIHYNLLQVASLLPWILLVWEKFLQKPQLITWSFFSILISQSLFASFYQLTLYELILISAVTIFHLLKKRLKFKLIILASFVFAVLTAFLLAGVQIMATLELLEKSSRGAVVNVSEIARYPYTPKDILTFVNPYIFGDPSKATYPPFSESWGIFWENSSYIGILPLILAIVGIFFAIYQKSKHFTFFVVFGLLSFLFALGKYGPFFFLETMPPLGLFRVPARFILLVVFSLAVLAAFGFENLTKKVRPANLIAIFLILIAFLNLYILGKPFMGGINKDLWLKPPQTAEFIQKNPGRIISVGQFENWNRVYKKTGWRKENAEDFVSTKTILDPNINLIWGISQLDGYSALVPRRSKVIPGLIYDSIKSSETDLKVGDIAQKLLDTYSVKYLVTSKSISQEGFKEVFEFQHKNTDTIYFVYQNLDFQQEFRPAQEAIIVSDLNVLISKLFSDDFDSRKQIVLEKDYKLDNPSIENVNIQVVSKQHSKVEISSKSTNPFYLLASISYYPGWKALVDGKEVEILAANLNQMAIPVQAGNHQIILKYKPDYLKIGLPITIVSHLTLLLLVLANFKLKLFKRSFLK